MQYIFCCSVVFFFLCILVLFLINLQFFNLIDLIDNLVSSYLCFIFCLSIDFDSHRFFLHKFL